MRDTLNIRGLVFHVRHSDRRKTLGLTVDRGAQLLVHVPTGTSEQEVSHWIETKLLWVHRKLLRKQQAAPVVHAPEYVSGETFYYLGRPYRLKVVDRQERPLVLKGTVFSLRRDARPAEECFKRWYMDTGVQWLSDRMRMLSPRVGTQPSRVELRDLGYRWGSCGKRDSLFFNWKMLQLPVRLLDYIIIHELVHLRHPNHTRGFREAIGCALPDWQMREEELKAGARTLFWCA